jgi:predicted RNA-binding protein associated with RNAse of E/G family
MLPDGWDDGHEAVEWMGDGVLRVHTFGEPWSVWRWLDADDRWSDDFYVNLEDPWCRTSVGFNSGDWVLDVVARVDGTWRYKNEDELEWAESMGVVDSAWVARTREAARNAIAAVEAKTWPFNANWDE